MGAAVGRPRGYPDTLFADHGYAHDKYRRRLRQHEIRAAIPERQQPYGTALGVFPQVVEPPASGLHRLRRLRKRSQDDATTSTSPASASPCP
ncbi:hypothetical protein ACFXGG_07915 [Streptomyces nigra]|uniref:hypothetical protein n=1 Tax=Streptomyces nigra TaxID=1827580 RepID=UPI0036BD95BC